MCSCLVDFVLGVVVEVGAIFDSSSFKEFLKLTQQEFFGETYFNQFENDDCGNYDRKYFGNMMMLDSIIKPCCICFCLLRKRGCFCRS